MKKLKILLLASLLFLLILAAVWTLKPVPVVTQGEAISVEGIVSKVYEGGKNDIIIELAQSDRSYYINRGKEVGLRIEDLKKSLLGKKVLIHYPDYWTPLDWNERFKHLSKLEQEDQIIYSEFDA